MKKPFFSISIPTYNRSLDLEMAIKSILRQSYSNFEIIVSDNSSNNQTENVCLLFKDKRIRYIKNRNNIGFTRNVYQVIKKASGKYVFLLGDDDLILKTDTLKKVNQLLTKKKYGYYRLKFIYHKNLAYLFDISKLQTMILEKHSTNLQTLRFINKVGYTFIAGNIFLNSKNFYIPQIENSTNPNLLMETFWLKFIYPQAKKYGAYLDSENIILSKWIINKKNLAGPAKDIPGLYDIIDNQIYVEKSWSLIFEELNTAEKKQWIKEQLLLMIRLLPSIKYYSSNRNLIKYVKRMYELDKLFIYNLYFYIFLLIALLMPKFLWNRLRTIVQNCHIVNDSVIMNNLEDLRMSFRRIRPPAV